MRSLRIALALLAVVVLHVLGTRISPVFPVGVDLFAVLVITVALEGSPLEAMLVGMFAGLTADALSGGPFGLNGFADTILGFGTASVVLRLGKIKAGWLLVIYALAAALQQGVLVLLALLLASRLVQPPLMEVVLKVVTTALIGYIFIHMRHRMYRMLGKMEEQRATRLRFKP